MASPDLLPTYLELIEKEHLYSSAGNFLFYSNYLFDRVPLEGRSVLDIGGGDGQYSFYALCRGAATVVCLEPEAAGSQGVGSSRFDRIRAGLGNPPGIRLERTTLQAFDPAGGRFDVVLLNNSINHLDEPACTILHRDAKAREVYRSVFARLHEMISAGGHLIIADCGRANFFPAIGMKNPMQRCIEWDKHQAPGVWVKLLEEVGFGEPRVRWSSFNHLRGFGRAFLGNPAAAYFLSSHFCLQMRKR